MRQIFKYELSLKTEGHQQYILSVCFIVEWLTFPIIFS